MIKLSRICRELKVLKNRGNSLKAEVAEVQAADVEATSDREEARPSEQVEASRES